MKENIILLRFKFQIICIYKTNNKPPKTIQQIIAFSGNISLNYGSFINIVIQFWWTLMCGSFGPQFAIDWFAIDYDVENYSWPPIVHYTV